VVEPSAHTSQISADTMHKETTSDRDDRDYHKSQAMSSSLSVEESVDVVIYLAVSLYLRFLISTHVTDNSQEADAYIKHTGTLQNGLYYLMKDETCCNIMDFPSMEWSVYDSVRGDFVGIPTFSYLAVSKGDILIFHPSSFMDSDCIGLNDLVGHINTEGKRRRESSADQEVDCTPSPSKRTRKSIGDDSELAVLDWTNL